MVKKSLQVDVEAAYLVQIRMRAIEQGKLVQEVVEGIFAKEFPNVKITN